jgi:hypothetical protein
LKDTIKLWNISEKNTDSFVFAMMKQDDEKANKIVDALMGNICQSQDTV